MRFVEQLKGRFFQGAQERGDIPVCWRVVHTVLANSLCRLVIAFGLVAVAVMNLDDEMVVTMKWSSTSSELFWRECLYWGSVAWMTTLIMAENRWVRWSAVCLCAATFALDHFYICYINGVGFVQHEISLAAVNPSTIIDSLDMYWQLSRGIVLTILALVITGAVLLKVVLGAISTKFAMWGAVIMAPLLCMVVVEGWGTHGQVVTPIRLPVFVANTLIEPMVPVREKCKSIPATEPLVDHIVLIMDESVMGSHIGANQYPRGTSPLLDILIKEKRAKSLGIASSACNYSVGSFLSVISGMTPDDLKTDYRQFLTRPSLLKYLAQRGFFVSVINSQDYHLWVAGELKEIGSDSSFITVDRNRLQHWEWDHSLIPAVAATIRDKKRSFTVIAKRGAHYPYYDKTPPGKCRFKPVLTSPEWSDDFKVNVNSYDNAMCWTCDNYLDTLLRKIDATGKSALIIYTSDHGQILPGQPIEGFVFKRTHAMLDSPSSGVADVPLILLASGEARAFIDQAPDANISKMSHFEIFPTVLYLAGYETERINRDYGRTVFQDVDPTRTREFFEGKPVKSHKLFEIDECTSIWKLIGELK
jgi:hypothetical protein